MVNFDDEEDIAMAFNNFCHDLLVTSHPERIIEVLKVIKDRISGTMYNILEAELS